ncbi:hypothetical protein [Streptomyces sp. NPDC050264]|uniref:hypothetical protein n=1 Tax=Streptomyces sp. NPDC050264 TaxID=3155038 RepID=UPI00343CBD67
MGFLSKWTGTRVPDDRVTPEPVTAVRDALLALNSRDMPFSVREGQHGEKADLVAECHIKRVGVRLKTSMRLVPEKHEVRVIHERWENRSAGNANGQYGRGHAPATFTQKETVTGPDGGKQRAEVFRFDTREMTNPLEVTVLRAGWTWRGVFRL